jgi:hypothetical protein
MDAPAEARTAPETPPEGSGDERAETSIPAADTPASFTGSAEHPADVEPVEETYAEPEPAPVAVAEEIEAAPALPPPEIEAPPIVPVDLDEARSLAADIPAAEDVESAAARHRPRRARRRGSRWPLSSLQSAILALVIVDSVLIGWRSDVVRLLPQMASFYSLIGLPVNLRGLEFDGVNTAKEQHEGVPVLVVEGNIVNTAQKTVEVPRLKFTVRNRAGQEIYSWTALPARTVLPPGEAVAFRSRLASPPPESRDVLVRFFNRRDLVAGVR